MGKGRRGWEREGVIAGEGKGKVGGMEVLYRDPSSVPHHTDMNHPIVKVHSQHATSVHAFLFHQFYLQQRLSASLVMTLSSQKPRSLRHTVHTWLIKLFSRNPNITCQLKTARSKPCHMTTGDQRIMVCRKLAYMILSTYLLCCAN